MAMTQLPSGWFSNLFNSASRPPAATTPAYGMPKAPAGMFGPTPGGGNLSPSGGGAGGFDLSGIGPQFSTSRNQSGGTNYSSSSNKTALNTEGKAALNPLLGTGPGSMPNLIDNWAAETNKNFKVTGDEMINALNQVANTRAQMGILGGTEAQNMRANMLTNLIQPTLQNRANTLRQASAMKTQAMPTLIELTRESQGGGTSGGTTSGNSYSYSQSPEDYRIIADIINRQY